MCSEIRFKMPLVVQPKEGYEMETPEKLEEAKKRKDAGNELFKQARSATPPVSFLHLKASRL